MAYGQDVEYRFEVAVISIAWTALIVGGMLLSVFFKRLGNTPSIPAIASGRE